MKEIKIKPANNGWIVEIGCQTFVAENLKKMLSEIGRYIEKPDKVEKEYMEKPKNKSESNIHSWATARIGGIIPSTISSRPSWSE